MKSSILAFSLGCVVLAVSNCTSYTPPVSSNAPSGRISADGSNLKEQINASTLNAIPAKPKERFLFDIYDKKNDSAWARNWTRRLDMTGVAWDSSRNATLISPLHVLMANHYKRGKGRILFHDAQGHMVLRQIVKTISLPGGMSPDLAVGLLDRPVPLKVYNVLPPRDDYGDLLPGAFAIITDQKREIFVHKVRNVAGKRISFSYAPEMSPFLKKNLIVGDSGNPSFVVIQGNPVLVGTHTFGGPGAGGFVSQTETYAALNDAMEMLGGGYQLSPVKFSSKP